jgi:Domain of unknown function (DUF4383)
MSHYPVNHPLRPFYRVLAALTALYVLVFGVVGTVQTIGAPMFDRSDIVVLGLRTNLAFALMSVGAGLVILLAIFVGRNVDRAVNLWGGVGFMAVGTALLALLHTELNVLNFSMPTVIVSFGIGLLLFTAGLYGMSAPATSGPQTAE